MAPGASRVNQIGTVTFLLPNLSGRLGGKTDFSNSDTYDTSFGILFGDRYALGKINRHYPSPLMSRNKADYTWLCSVLGLRLELYVPLTGTQLPHRSTAKIGDQMSWKGYVVSINLLRALMDTMHLADGHRSPGRCRLVFPRCFAMASLASLPAIHRAESLRERRH